MVEVEATDPTEEEEAHVEAENVVEHVGLL
jgi:hypothetical protein